MTTKGRSVARSVALLVALVGLLAMHGLASTHHGPAVTSKAAAAQPHVEHQASVGHVNAATAAISELASMAPDARPQPLCGGACPNGLAVMCLTVITVAAAAAAAASRRVTSPWPRRSPGAPRAPAPRPVLRLLDPVADLCVSRT